MNLFETFPASSRVWIYECNRVLLPSEVAEISARATAFTAQWTAHQQLLKADFDIRYDLFLIFCVDENSAAASGCSIDKSLHLVKQLEKDYNIRFLDRMMTAFLLGDEAVPFNVKELNTLYTKGAIADDTLVFNNLANTVLDLNANWIVPLKQSWMMQMLTSASAVK